MNFIIQNKKWENYLKINFGWQQRVCRIGLRQPKLASANEGWDYTWPGLYYVTICTQNRESCLGEVKNREVYLSKIGKIVFESWINIPEHFEFVELDDWIIMPNHLHGILAFKDIDSDAGKDFGASICRDARSRVSTVNKFGPLQPKSLSSVVHAFKSSVKRQCNNNDLAFAWQERYYEHIVKDDDEYVRIKEYIALNPINWKNDRNNHMEKEIKIIEVKKNEIKK